MLPQNGSSNVLVVCDELQTDSSVVVNIPMKPVNSVVMTERYSNRSNDGTLRATYLENNNSKKGKGPRSQFSQSLTAHPKQEYLATCNVEDKPSNVFQGYSTPTDFSKDSSKDGSKKRKVIHANLDMSGASGLESQLPRKASSGFSHRITRMGETVAHFIGRFINMFLFILYNIYLIYSIVKTWHKVSYPDESLLP